MKEHDILVKRFLSILESVNFGVLVESEERTIVLVNDKFLEMFQVPVSSREFMKIDCEAAAQGAKVFFKNEDYFIESIHEILSKQEQILDQLLEMKDGRFLERDYYPVFVENKYRGHAWLYKDVTAKHLLQDELEKMATIDELTKIYNRRKFHEEYNHHLRLGARYSRPLTLLMADVDNFKGINDNYGHHAGDNVLRKISSVMSSNKRDVDVLGRWGGEEFIMLLPETKIDKAKIVAERIRHAVEISKVEGVDSTITLSIGIAEFIDNDDDVSILRRADDALYEAKRNGKNAVVCFNLK